ncbi:PAS domain S-box protein [Candidatus Bipolaricaulota sp. J31]
MENGGLLQFLRALNRGRDPEEIGETVLAHALGRVPGARCGLFIVLDEISGRFVPRASRGWKGTTGPISRERARDVLGFEPRIVHGRSGESAEILWPVASVLSLPVPGEGKVIAYLLLGNPDDPQAFSTADVERLGPEWEDIVAAVRRTVQCGRSGGTVRLGVLLECLPDAVVVADETGTIRVWNKGAEELFGYTAREVLGKPLTILMPEEYRERHREAFAKCVAEGRSPRRFVEGRGLRKDGRTFPIQWSLTCRAGDGGTVIIAVGRDLTEKVEIERELRESEQRFKMLFERLPDAVYITAFGGRILAANPAAAHQTGYSLEELLQMNIVRDLVVGKPNIPVAELEERLARGETVVFEERKRRKDGTVYWTECAVTRIEYQGRPATLSVNRDVTERKRLEEVLQRHVKELEALNDALRSLVSALEMEEVLRRLADVTGKLVDAEYVMIGLFDEEGHPQKVVARPMGLGPLPLRMRPKGMTRAILTTGEPLVVGDVSPDGSTSPPIRAPDGSVIPANPVIVEVGVRSFAGVPIKYKDRVTGILSVFSRRPHVFDDRLPILSSLADAAAVAVENARLYEEARYLFEESPVSLWVEDFSAIKERLDSLRAQGVTDLKSYIEDHREFVEECVRLLRVEEVNRTTLRLYRVRDVRELIDRLPEIIPPHEVNPVLVEELLAIWEGRHEFEGVGINRTADGDTIHIHLRWRVFPGHEEDFARVLVSILDITERVQVEEKLRTHVEKLAALHRAVWDLQRCRTVEEVCRAAVEGARGILGFSVCNIGLVEGDRVVPVYTVGDIRARPFPRGQGLVWRTLEEGRSFWGNIEDLPGAKPVDPRLKSVISVPIGDIGVFQAASFEPDAFGEDDVKLAEILAGHVSEEIRRVRLEQELRERAIRDALTGLYNRGYLMEVLEREIQEAKREGRSLAVLVSDLDNFKLVNDRFGHPFGDEVLRGVARLLRETVLETDLIFRYGGDEFVFIFPEMDGKAREVARRVKDAVARWAETKGLSHLGFGISLGVAIWRPDDPLPPEELLRRADRDLYRSKRGS